MSPRSLFFLFVVGLCATQMASAHREARAVAGLFNAVTAKLTGYLTNAEGPIQAGINAVKQHINNLENMFLESGTNALQKAGIQVDLKALSTLVKGKIHGCASNDQIKGGAMEILNDMSSCVTKDVANLKGLISKMDGLWETAKNMPQAIRNVAARCQSDEAVPEEPLKLTLDTSDHELAEASNEMLQAASKHVSKRALGGLLRLARCAKKVFDYAKGDLVNKIPGGVMGLSTGAYRIVQSVQGGIPACVAMKATENVGKITKLGLDVKSCVASGLTDASADNNPSLKALKQLANVAGVALKTLG